MAKISGIVFILIGVLLAFVSQYLNNLQGTNSLTLFIYIGYAMLAYGVAKVIIGYVLRRGKVDKISRKEELPENLPKDLAKASRKVDLYGYIGICRRCNTPMRKINVYCHRCGVKQS